ncbi:MAG: hypothetical protein ACI4HI_06010 [Lachnospiraceae bacterium]
MGQRMKRTVCILIMLMCMLVCVILGTKQENVMQDDTENGVTSEKKQNDFLNITWARETEADTEYLTFYSDGTFSYYCACGNPVNDADLCEGYVYDEKTELIQLQCEEATNDMVTSIKRISCDGKHLKLDFDGDIRIFTKEEIEMEGSE